MYQIRIRMDREVTRRSGGEWCGRPEQQRSRSGKMKILKGRGNLISGIKKKKIIIETNKRKFNKKKGLIVIFAKSSHLSRKGIVIACPGRQKPSCATGDMLGIHERKNHGESCRYGNTLFLVEF